MADINNVKFWFCMWSYMRKISSRLEPKNLATLFSFDPSLDFLTNRCEHVLDRCSDAKRLLFINIKMWSLFRRYGYQHEKVHHCAWIAHRTMHRCCQFHRSCSSSVWKIRRHLVSADFNGGSRFVCYLKFCRYHVRDAQRRDLEIPRWLVLL